MKVVKDISEARAEIKKARTAGKIVGFIPTMGALHAGHISLVEAAKKQCDFVAVSIFVNPAQFGPDEDFKKYPRVFKSDEKLLQKEKVDLIFYPSASQMYPDNFSTYVEEALLSKPLCGLSRPGHFRGVCTIVAKLFNIITPDIAYFGQKDYQQAMIIKRMAEDLNFSTIVKICPIVRESDGLAMSSRNVYLNPAERKDALVLAEALKLAEKSIKEGQTDAVKIIEEMYGFILSKKTARIDYVEIVDAKTLQEVEEIKQKVLIALAVYIGKTRLIDNVVVHAKSN
ncbi:MAG: pantoate--beta-alanine ligase [Candidatus Omnitrophica bacterium]|nr:pantoate--beta-alanine ligase [Candidatus Omnitrophota bacterium]